MVIGYGHLIRQQQRCKVEGHLICALFIPLKHITIKINSSPLLCHRPPYFHANSQYHVKTE